MVLSNPRLLRTGVSDSQLYSGSWSEPPVAGCRLGTMVRSRQRTRVRRAHSFGCHKHRVRFGLRWTLAISGPRRCTDCGPSCSSRPADPWATENRPGLGELPVKPATQTNAIEQPSPRNYWLSSAELKNRGFAKQPLARRSACKLDGTFAGRRTLSVCPFVCNGLARQKFRICLADRIQFVISSESMSWHRLYARAEGCAPCDRPVCRLR